MTRKTGFKLIYYAYHKKQSKNSERIFSGEVMLVKGRTGVAKVKFYIDETQIFISDVDTDSRHKRCGYGRLMMEYMMFLAEVIKLPILLFSVSEVEKFYVKLGMERCISAKMQRRLVVINENPDNSHEWWSGDFIWIPKCLRRKRKLRVYA